PVRLFHGLKSPLADRAPGDIDYWIVRENNEGEYSSIGGRMFEGTELEAAIQTAVFTKKGCERVMRYAFDLAMTRKRREVASATVAAIERLFAETDVRTADMGGKATCKELGTALVELVRRT